MAAAAEDPHLGPGPDEDGSEVSLFGGGSDSDSLLSDDSVLPNYRREAANGSPAATLYKACARNQLHSLRRILERGVTKDEVEEVDINGWNGLMVACCKGFLDIVYGLHSCPFLDINVQDNEGNTALMIASQAGHVCTVMYLLNYFPGADAEIRDCRGFTALIKAAMTGRNDIVAALIMAGADIYAVDATRGKCAMDWALTTGRYDTSFRIRRLILRPKAEQFCESYVPEWPELGHRVTKATAERTASEKITQRLKNTFSFSIPRDPQDNGVLDHMVRMTTGIHSPLVTTGCHPLRPTSPPEVGKRRLAVPELVRKYTLREVEVGAVCHSDGSVSLIPPSVPSSDSIATACCAEAERRGSMLSLASTKVTSFIPRGLARRNSVFPSGCIPQINVSRSADATPKKEKKKKKKKQTGYLEPPQWRYKVLKEEKKKAENENDKKEKREKDKKEKREKDKKAKKK